MLRPLGIVVLLLLGKLALAAPVFFAEASASPYDHDRVGKQAGRTLMRFCADQGVEQSQRELAGLKDWQVPDGEAPPGVMLRERRDFAGERGLSARLRIGRHGCTLTLSPYRPTARAGDELAYGVSEAAARHYGDAENNWQPEQTMTGLHRIGADRGQYEQTLFLQFQQAGGLPSLSWFALFDTQREPPRVVLGRRDFNGRVIFGIADSDWQSGVTQSGKRIVSIRGKDPVDTQTGGLNALAISKNARGRFELKAWLPIGSTRPPFRLQRSLGDDPLVGFERLLIAVPEGDRLVERRLQARVLEKIRAREAMLARGLYPVYLELDEPDMARLVEAEFFSLVLTRKGGSEIRLQVPAGQSLAERIGRL